jgi:type II secretory pathway component PulF
MAEPITPATFAYQAQSPDGVAFTGTIDAAAIDDAARQLQSLHLQVTRLEPATKPVAAAPFRSADFLAFNQQLAQLTKSGLPIERSLRLMAVELSDKRQTAAIQQIADQLEKGTPLAAAFASQQKSFPSMYATLLEAGVRSNNLPAMLLNLGRHVQMLQRLRAAWWRSASYPLMVLSSLLAVMLFIWVYIMPRFRPLDYGPVLQPTGWRGYLMPTGSTAIDPTVELVLSIAGAVSYTIVGLIAALLLSVLILCILSRTSTGRSMVEKVVLPLPLIGPILKWNLVARWCDALHLGVQGGLPLPDALGLARDAVQSQKLRADSQVLINTVNGGQSMELDTITHFLPPLIPTTLQLGIEKNDLPAAAAMLTQMYEEQAEIRLAVLPRVLSPLLLLLTASCVGIAVVAVLMPLVMMIREFTR